MGQKAQAPGSYLASEVYHEVQAVELKGQAVLLRIKFVLDGCKGVPRAVLHLWDDRCLYIYHSICEAVRQ